MMAYWSTIGAGVASALYLGVAGIAPGWVAPAADQAPRAALTAETQRVHEMEKMRRVVDRLAAEQRGLSADLAQARADYAALAREHTALATAVQTTGSLVAAQPVARAAPQGLPDASPKAKATAPAPKSAPKDEAASTEALALTLVPLNEAELPAERPADPPRVVTGFETRLERATSASLGVHLISRTSAARLPDDWAKLKTRYPILLAGLEARRVTLPAALAGGAPVHKLVAGPLADATAVDKICDALKRDSAFCDQATFEGDRL